MQIITVSEYQKSFPKLEKELDGNAMCAMKWIHQYVNLDTGAIKMCHNVPNRYVTQKEVDTYGKDIFFNHPYEVARRKEKLSNIRHSECSSCWNNEDKGIRSCRLPQPFYDLHRSRFKENNTSPVSPMPTQLELSFGNECDLKCLYCSLEFSSQWETEEIKYNKLYQPVQKAPNRFTDVFWSWLEEDAVDCILQYYIVGGEPLLNPNFYSFLEKLINLLKVKKNKFNVKPELIIVTNANTPEKYLEKWISIIPELTEYMTVQINISIEGYEERAQYIRTNLNWNRFSRNVEKIYAYSEKFNLKLRFSITHSTMSISSTLDLLKWIKQLKDKYSVEVELIRTSVSKPKFLAPYLLTKDFKIYIDNINLWIYNHAPEWNYYVDFLNGISNSFGTKDITSIQDFLDFIKKMKERKNLDARKIFPEMEEWFNYCERICTI